MANQVLQRFEKLRPVQKVGVFAAIIGVVVAGWYFLLYKKVVEDLETQVNRGSALQAQVGGLTTKKQNFDKLKIALAQLKAKADPDVVLPDKAQIPALLKTLQDDATLAGIQIIKWDIQSEVPFYANGVAPPAPGAPAPPGQPAPAAGAAPPPMRVPVAIVMRGSFNKLNRWFFAAYGTKSDAPGEDKRLISIEQLKILPETDPEASAAGLLTASFVASTFRKADAPPPLPGQAAAPGAAPNLKSAVLKNADTVDKMDK